MNRWAALQDIPAPASSGRYIDPLPNAAYGRELRRLFHALARRHHPDRGGGGEWMPVIVHAYRRRNLSSLWRLMLADAPTGDLAAAIAAIEETCRDLARSITQLEASPACRLMRRAEEAARDGWDLGDAVAQQIGRELSVANR